MKKILPILIIFFLFLLFLIPSILAVPPSDNYFIGDQGLQVQTATIPYVKVSTPGNLILHIFNLSNGVLIQYPDVTCNGTLSYPNGSDMATETATPHENHFEFPWNSSMMPSVGLWSYTIYCNSTNPELGGYYTGYFEVNETGEDLTTGSDLYYVVSLILIILSSSLFYIGNKVELFFIEYNRKVAKDKYEVVKVFVDKYFIYLVACWLFIPLISIAMKINELYSLGLTNTLDGLYSGTMWLLGVVSVFAIILILVYLFNELNDYILEKMK